MLKPLCLYGFVIQNVPYDARQDGAPPGGRKIVTGPVMELLRVSLIEIQLWLGLLHGSPDIILGPPPRG